MMRDGGRSAQVSTRAMHSVTNNKLENSKKYAEIGLMMM
jgi:hypothetical protein